MKTNTNITIKDENLSKTLGTMRYNMDHIEMLDPRMALDSCNHNPEIMNAFGICGGINNDLHNAISGIIEITAYQQMLIEHLQEQIEELRTEQTTSEPNTPAEDPRDLGEKLWKERVKDRITDEFVHGFLFKEGFILTEKTRRAGYLESKFTRDGYAVFVTSESTSRIKKVHICVIKELISVFNCFIDCKDSEFKTRLKFEDVGCDDTIKGMYDIMSAICDDINDSSFI